MNRRTGVFSFLGGAAAIVASRPSRSTALPTVVVYHNPGCGCCEGWMKHMRAAGFEVLVDDDTDLDSRRESLRIPAEFASCHIALVEGYTLEGHIPPADIVRFPAERPPDALGLVVPGMPVGSPGMGPEGCGDRYDMFLLKANAAPTFYAHH